MSFAFRAAPLALAAAYCLCVLWLCQPSFDTVVSLASAYALGLASVWCIAGLLALMAGMISRQMAGKPYSAWAIARDFFLLHWRHDRCFSIVSPLVTCTLLIASYNVYKQLCLPRVGFWFGRYIAQFERTILGQDAWRYTHEIFSSPFSTQVFDALYHSWFLPMSLGVAVCSFARPGTFLAWRYLTTYVLLWIVLGTVMAYFVPAAGPAINSIMNPDQSKFSPLVALINEQDSYLRAIGQPGLYSIHYQYAMSQLFGTDALIMGAGISAMPSMHCALATLFACAVATRGRIPGLLAALYGVLIWLSSIHLGWHYALDGIVSAPLTILIWHLVGRALPQVRESAAGENKPAGELEPAGASLNAA